MASAAAVLQGEIALEKFQRFASLLVDSQGSIGIELVFSRDEARRVAIDGVLRGEVRMTCQRCLEPVAVALQGDLALTLVADESLVERVSEAREVLVADAEQAVPLVSLLEDDLILALPAVARHAHCEIPGQARDATDRQGDREPDDPDDDAPEHPFAVLKTLRDEPGENE